MTNLEFPNEFIEFKLDRELNELELARIKEGSFPRHMDDKWIIYFQDTWLYFHRFLTRYCIYKVHIMFVDSTVNIDKVLINGDPKQYKSAKENEPELFLEIFNLFLEAKIR
jgi:hypothetical protein